MLERLNLRFGQIAMIVGAVAVMVACGDSAVVAPTAGTPTISPAIVGSITPTQYVSATDPQLLDWLAREQRRIDSLKTLSLTLVSTTNSTLDAVASNTTVGSRLLSCAKLPYAAQTKIVGPLGASFSFGPHKLTIPVGALVGWTVITAEAPVSSLVQTKFAPHGLKFVARPELKISYNHCVRPPDGKHIVYVDASGRILEHVKSLDVKTSGWVQGPISHFSSYMIAY
jgi:hypothetical protein